jgi:hypothetical protein
LSFNKDLQVYYIVTAITKLFEVRKNSKIASSYVNTTSVNYIYQCFFTDAT